ncbi:MAG: riboflavin synthase [FCB group bacterium]|nr:riboflavin synthase [FCB group bacterium]
MMFTGLIEEQGKITAVRKNSAGVQLEIQCSRIPKDLKIDDSVAVSGVCLTATSVAPDRFRVQAVPETIRRTTVGNWKNGTRVNLERACTPETRLGGHLVQGHVDGVVTLRTIKKIGAGAEWQLKIPEQLTRYCVEKGSVALEGVSLTIADITADLLKIALIPHTLEVTNLGTKKVGDRLNMEVDILAKYVEKLITAGTRPIRYEYLKNLGYDHE